MLTILTATGRVLLAHWPALLAWFLAGRIVHYAVIEVAGFVGASSSTGGLLILPLAILARLVSFVAMFLVLRSGLRQLQAVAPEPPRNAERRRTFLRTLLASILPFFAIYTAWGMLRDDMIAYARRALEVNAGLALQSILDDTEAPTGEIGTAVGINALTVLIVLVTFVGRWAWKKWPKKLPAAFAVLAVYFEAVWVCLSLVLISSALEGLNAWVDTRVGIQWVLDLRDWLGEQLVPVARVWDGVEWLIGEVSGLVVEPLAWLAIAGVIYGQAIAAEKPKLNIALFHRASRRVQRVPDLLRRMLGQLGAEFTSRFTPIVNAVALMWRAGPVMIGSFVLFYTVVLAASDTIGLLISRLIGPQDLQEFWGVADEMLIVVVAMIVEPIRISLVAAVYDGSLGALRRQRHIEAALLPAGGQGSIENLTNEGMADTGATSTQNGPFASSGTRNGTTISYGSTGASSSGTTQDVGSSTEYSKPSS